LGACAIAQPKKYGARKLYFELHCNVYLSYIDVYHISKSCLIYHRLLVDKYATGGKPRVDV
jgi:hypothetical protein